MNGNGSSHYANPESHEWELFLPSTGLTLPLLVSQNPTLDIWVIENSNIMTPNPLVGQGHSSHCQIQGIMGINSDPSFSQG